MWRWPTQIPGTQSLITFKDTKKIYSLSTKPLVVNSPGFAPAGGCFVDLSAGKISLKITFSSESHSLPPTLHASPLLQSKFSCHLNFHILQQQQKLGKKTTAHHLISLPRPPFPLSLCCSSLTKF